MTRGYTRGESMVLFLFEREGGDSNFTPLLAALEYLVSL